MWGLRLADGCDFPQVFQRVPYINKSQMLHTVIISYLQKLQNITVSS
jgi:hypothetical protein